MAAMVRRLYTAETIIKGDELTNKCQELMSSPDGALLAELAVIWGLTNGGTYYRISMLIKRGQVFDTLGERDSFRRYFSTEAARDAWAAERRPMHPSAVARRALESGYLTAPRLASLCGEIDSTAASNALVRMWRNGEIFRVLAQGMGYYFASEADATAGTIERIKAETAALMKERTAKAVAARNRTPKQKAGVDAGVHIPARDRQSWASKEADMSRAKVTICDAPASYSRTYVDPKTRVVGGFAAMGIGRYSE